MSVDNSVSQEHFNMLFQLLESPEYVKDYVVERDFGYEEIIKKITRKRKREESVQDLYDYFLKMMI